VCRTVGGATQLEGLPVGFSAVFVEDAFFLRASDLTSFSISFRAPSALPRTSCRLAARRTSRYVGLPVSAQCACAASTRASSGQSCEFRYRSMTGTESWLPIARMQRKTQETKIRFADVIAAVNALTQRILAERVQHWQKMVVHQIAQVGAVYHELHLRQDLTFHSCVLMLESLYEKLERNVRRVELEECWTISCRTRRIGVASYKLSRRGSMCQATRSRGGPTPNRQGVRWL